MPNVIEIADLSLPELAPYARLTEAQLLCRRHPEQGLFLAESAAVIGCALDAGYTPVSFLMERRQLDGAARALLARGGDVPVYTGERALLERLTGYALTRGMLCAMRRKPLPSPEQVCAGARRVAVLENLADAANVGAAFRSAAALGVDAVLLSPGCCDPLYRRALRVSMGTVLQVPWARIGEQDGAWMREGPALLRALGFYTAALALRDDALWLDDARLAAVPRLALVLGAEGVGLAEQTIAGCDCAVRIPMSHGVDSLNVAAASAVAFWQLRVR